MAFLIKYINFITEIPKIIKQIVDYIESSEKHTFSREIQRSYLILESQKAKQNRILIFKKKNRDLRNKIFRIQPCLNTGHVYKIFGMMGVNERAISIPDFDESLFVTHFYRRNIQKIQIYRNAILIDLTAAKKSQIQFTNDQISQKFKSYGENKFYNLALQIEEATELFYKFMPSFQSDSKVMSDSITKYLDSLGDSMYLAKFGMNKIAISKILLEYLEYDLQQFVIVAVKYRTIFNQQFYVKIEYFDPTATLQQQVIRLIYQSTLYPSFKKDQFLIISSSLDPQFL